MDKKVKKYIHRGLITSISDGYVIAKMRAGHYNEDGTWMPFVYLLHQYHLKEDYPYKVETFYKFGLLVDRMKAIASVEDWR